MIIYHGSIRKFDSFDKDTVVKPFIYEIDTIGFWFTSEIDAAKAYSKGTETVIEKSKTEFWEDGKAKIVQYDKQVNGYIYKVYVDDIQLKEYASQTEDSFDLFMMERDLFCDYFSAKKGSLTWKDKAILLNKEEANSAFRNSLVKQGYAGILIRNTKQSDIVTDLYCIFSANDLLIVETIPVVEMKDS